jgi:hypothetical protein
VATVLGLRTGATLGLAAVALAMQVFLPLPPLIPQPDPVMTPLWTVVAGVAGFFLPDLWLRERARKRQQTSRTVLPDAIDVLSISVEAGLGVDAACDRICQQAQTEQTVACDKYLMQIRLGTPHREALRPIRTRTGGHDRTTCLAAGIQADQVGVRRVRPATILRTQREPLYRKRRQGAAQLAQQAPLTMLFPMLLVIFPSLRLRRRPRPAGASGDAPEWLAHRTTALHEGAEAHRSVIPMECTSKAMQRDTRRVNRAGARTIARTMRPRTTRGAACGQALTELALFAPLLGIILLGILELSAAYGTVMNVQGATAQAARIGALEGTNANVDADMIKAVLTAPGLDPASIQQIQIYRASPSGSIDISGTTPLSNSYVLSGTTPITLGNNWPPSSLSERTGEWLT